MNRGNTFLMTLGVMIGITSLTVIVAIGTRTQPEGLVYPVDLVAASGGGWVVADFKAHGLLSMDADGAVTPPRAGLRPAVIEGIASTRADRVVYISCNPETLARDCKQLCAHNHAVSEIHPLDMFPQTTHVESVAKLVRGGRV